MIRPILVLENSLEMGCYLQDRQSNTVKEKSQGYHVRFIVFIVLSVSAMSARIYCKLHSVRFYASIS